MSAARLAAAADITPEWLVAAASALRAEGQAFRPGAHAAVIEVQSINTGRWMPLNLPTNGALFDSEKTRDHALAFLDLEVRHGDLAAALKTASRA